MVLTQHLFLSRVSLVTILLVAMPELLLIVLRLVLRAWRVLHLLRLSVRADSQEVLILDVALNVGNMMRHHCSIFLVTLRLYLDLLLVDHDHSVVFIVRVDSLNHCSRLRV